MLGASQAVLLGAAGCEPKPPTYATTVAGIPGLLAYWPCTSVHQLTDATGGGRHGTYDGTVSLVLGLVTGGDNATFLPGTVSGTIPHDPGLALEAFSLSLWFRITQTDAATILFSKDASGLINGRFFINVRPGGALGVRFRETGEDGVEFHEIVMPEGTVEADTTYHLVVTAGPSGFELWLNGQHRESNGDFGRAWAENDLDIKLGAAYFNPNPMTGVLDEIALYSRVIDDAEIVALSQNTATPTAANASISVTEGESTVVNVLPECTFVGRSGSLSFEFNQGSRGTASVNGANAIVYTADADEGGETDSFQYRLADANGTSTYATVSVTIQAVAADPPPSDEVPAALINPFPASSGDTVVVSSMDALESAVNSAPPGRHILIAAGAYTGGTRTFNRNGTAANPIVIKPQGARGSVTINAPTWTMNGSRLVITNLYFNNPQIRVNGQNMRVSRCRFRQVNRNCIVPNGFNMRIDHNDVSDYQNNDNQKRWMAWSDSNFKNGTFKGCLFDHNDFHDITSSSPSAFIHTTGGAITWDADIYMYKCRFENNDISTHGEIIVIKYSGMHVMYCTFRNVRGYVQQRQGSGCQFRSNWFEGPRINSAPLKLWDSHDPIRNCVPGKPPTTAIGNRFIGGLRMWVPYGDDDTCDTGVGQHPAAYNAKIIGNVFDTGSIQVGVAFGSTTFVNPAKNNLLAANIRNGAPMSTSNGIELVPGRQQNTTIQNTVPPGYSWTPAVRLTASDVGMAAPDPFHPAGPQS